MSIRSFLGAMIFLLPGISIAATSGPAIPDTPAGRTLGSWLDAFNSGDSARIKAFDDTHAPWLALDRAMELRAHSGGYDVLGIDKSEKLWITFSAREKATATPISGTLVVKPDDPDAISLLLLNPAGPEPNVVTLTEAERDQMINDAAKLLAEFYVFPDMGQKMAAALRTQQKRRDYREITNGEVLATRLSDDLRAISHDKHVSVHFSWDVVPPDPTDKPNQNRDTDTRLRKRLEASNCSFEKAEHLPPNIGYLKLNGFADTDICAGTAIAALNFLADSDALIIDLRDNHGGRPEMVTLIASYLFAVPTHLNDAYDRSENITIQFWTAPFVSGKRFIDKPVFLLTSRQTFSAAEDFSYALKNLKRATLIGENTGGGAHPISPRRIDDHFTVIVPIARSISPITKTDWEGTGVEPDVKVAAADALDEALKRARDQTASAGSPR
jgi:Peptidase family S41/N-terminal domain of Peptidase_S41 in eukaryotic IRBP